MADKSVLFVGLQDDQVTLVALPEDVASARVDDCDEALDHVALTPPDLIVANDTIGELDSLDFFGRLIDANPDSSTPVFFLAPPESGVRPFLYQRRRSGFEVRYLDTAGAVHAHFVKEKPTEKSYTVRALDPDLLSEEIVRFLSGGAALMPEEEDLEQRTLELGFNQDVLVEGAKYHVQTEVVAVTPLTVSSSVFCGGRAVHSQQQRIEPKPLDFGDVRSKVESIHAGIVGRVTTGDLQ